MKIMVKLAVRQLLKNRKRTLVTIIGIVLSVSMITAVAGFVEGTREMMRQTYIAQRGDYHVGLRPVTAEQAEAIAADYRVESSFTKPEEPLAIYFRLRDVNRRYENTAAEISEAYGVAAAEYDFNKELLAVEGVIAGDRSLNTMLAVGGLVTAIILAGSVIVIANAFNISAQERVRQFGVLKSAGATKEQIRYTVLAEGLALSVVAVPIGILVGFVVETVALAIANGLLYEVNLLNDGVLEIKPVYSGAAVAVAAVLSLVTVLLSAWTPAVRAAKISAIEAISLSHEIKIKPNTVKASPLIGKLFGFEGSLAARALRRSRGKYRATVISLVVSVALFILGSGLGAMISQSADMVYKDFGVNVIMYAEDGSAEEITRISEGLSQLPGEVNSAKTFLADTELPLGYLTEDALQHWGGEGIETLRLIAVDDALYDDIRRAAGISPGVQADSHVLSGILANFSILDSTGRRVVFAPFNYERGDTFAVGGANAAEGYEIELGGAVSNIDDIPSAVAPFMHLTSLNVILSEAAFGQIMGGGNTDQVYWVANAKDPAGYSEAAGKIFRSVFSEDRYNVVNYEQNARVTQSINLLLLIFVYGFVGMLSLIAVTSVLGTISTNINLRLPEFAMLSSVGMTPRGLRRMLNLESLFYGIKALAIGLPVSLALYYAMYKAFGISVDFAFIWPWQSMLISAAAVLLITFATMRYSTKMIRGKNIAELIRTLNL